MQRSLENGDEITGVSVVLTELRMDAGPLFRQKSYRLQGHEKSEEVLSKSFSIGTELLLDLLPDLFSGHAHPLPQDESLATKADKLSSNDSLVDFHKLTASQIHNKCRAQSVSSILIISL